MSAEPELPPPLFKHRQLQLARAIGELDAVVRRYARLSELTQVWRAIAETRRALRKPRP